MQTCMNPWGIVVRRGLGVLLATLVLAGCVRHSGDGRGEEVPLAQFIIGRWKSVEATEGSGKESPYTFDFEFLPIGIVRSALLNEDGQFLDGSISPYWFLDATTLQVDDPRIAGGQRWEISRSGEQLIVVATTKSSELRMVLARVSEP